MICTACRKEAPKFANYCPACGAAVEVVVVGRTGPLRLPNDKNKTPAYDLAEMKVWLGAVGYEVTPTDRRTLVVEEDHLFLNVTVAEGYEEVGAVTVAFCAPIAVQPLLDPETLEMLLRLNDEVAYGSYRLTEVGDVEFSYFWTVPKVDRRSFLWVTAVILETLHEHLNEELAALRSD